MENRVSELEDKVEELVIQYKTRRNFQKIWIKHENLFLKITELKTCKSTIANVENVFNKIVEE